MTCPGSLAELKSVGLGGLTYSTISTIINRMDSPPTTLGYALLGLLHQEPRSGYDLRKIFETTPMGHYSGSPGAIYPALRRLKQRSLIQGEVDRSKSLRPREMFQPTTAGTEAFREWLARDVGPEDVIWNVDELMLRFAFHSFLESAEATRRFLSSFSRETERYVKKLREEIKRIPASTPSHGRLALECGLEQYQAYRRWAKKALQQFEE